MSITLMNGAGPISHSIEEDGREMMYSLYNAPSEQAGSSAMEFAWAHPTAIGLHSPRQSLVGETWDYRNEFEMESNPIDPELFEIERTMGPPIDSTTSLDRADYISSEQGVSPEEYCLDSSEAHDMTLGDQSPDSSPSARRTTSTDATTPMESASAVTELKEHRERNRVAARKCRQKAKHNFTSLQRREKELSQKNKALHNHVGGLRDEILDLKNEILRHSGCNSNVIQNYIANAARRQSA